eukprot:gene9464-10454_t
MGSLTAGDQLEAWPMPAHVSMPFASIEEEVLRGLSLPAFAHATVLQELQALGEVERIPAEVINRNLSDSIHTWLFEDPLRLEETVLALHLFAKRGHAGLVGLLLDHPQVDINVPTEKSGWTALYLASLKGHTEVVEVLLANSRLDVNKCTQGWTALLVACSNGHLKVVEMLLADSRLVATQCTWNGWTPLVAASSSGHLEVVQLLLADSRVSVNQADWNGSTVLHAASCGGHKRVLEVFLSDERLHREVCRANKLRLP